MAPTATVERRAAPARAVPGPLDRREWWALRWVAEQGVTRLDVVGALLGGDEPLPADRVRRVVDRWRRAGLIERDRILATGPPFCWPTRAGLRVVGVRQRPRSPTVGRLDHQHTVSLVRLGVERLGGRAWAGEPTLYRQRRAADDHVADGRFVTADGTVTAVEVELTVKAARRLRSIVDDLTLEYGAVLYVVRGVGVRHAVEQAVDALDEWARVRIVDLAWFALHSTR
ncbi:MAG TPA: hypothetical protein VLV81_05585 [Acidimicrobiia bacterium]|nr:hypothetical protein [Acidimicrobiia bacterium]